MHIDVSDNNGKPYLRLVKSVRIENAAGKKVSRKEHILSIGPVDRFDDGKPDYIACYLRIKAGKTKSGHGVYERRSPFVLFRFLSLDGALKVLGKEVEFVEGVEKGYVETVGAPEYAMYLNDFMAVLQGMLT